MQSAELLIPRHVELVQFRDQITKLLRSMDALRLTGSYAMASFCGQPAQKLHHIPAEHNDSIGTLGKSAAEKLSRPGQTNRTKHANHRAHHSIRTYASTFDYRPGVLDVCSGLGPMLAAGQSEHSPFPTGRCAIAETRNAPVTQKRKRSVVLMDASNDCMDNVRPTCANGKDSGCRCNCFASGRGFKISSLCRDSTPSQQLNPLSTKPWSEHPIGSVPCNDAAEHVGNVCVP